MNEIVSKQDCCGCTSCLAACPSGAISYDADPEGFLYPSIIQGRCIDCGLCQKVCPVFGHMPESVYLGEQAVYALHTREESTWMQASSGGVFEVLSRYILEKQGVVYGVGYNEDLRVRHGRASNIKEMLVFRGAKYVQSDLRGIFGNVRSDLESRREVLFSGAPCQVEGLRKFLRKPFPNLLTVDLICHGVPSPKIFREYILWAEKQTGKKIISMNMKDKTSGWGDQSPRIFFSDGSDSWNTPVSRLWNRIFYSSLVLRPSCHVCRFANYHRPGDLTIGDYWGIEKAHPSFFDCRGISLALVNTEKGKDVFEAIRDCFEVLPSSREKCHQPNLEYPTASPAERERFWQQYLRNGFGWVCRKYWNYGWKEQVWMLLKGRKS